jgi:tetratricopeptide (TPR) repeat protein
MRIIKGLGISVFFIFMFLVLIECGLRFAGFLVHVPKNVNLYFSQKQTQGVRILCLGESTTDGQWPRYLEEALRNADFENVRFSIIDKGRAALDSAQIISELPRYIRKYKPSIVIAMVGINDDTETISYYFTSIDKFHLFLHSFRIFKFFSIIKERLQLVSFQAQEAFAEIETFQAQKKKIVAMYQGDKEHIDYYRELGNLLKTYWKYDEAITLLREGLDAYPACAEIAILLATCYWNSGKSDLASDVLQGALFHSPFDRELLMSAAHCFFLKTEGGTITRLWPFFRLKN